jgi:hypothetical protein
MKIPVVERQFIDGFIWVASNSPLKGNSQAISAYTSLAVMAGLVPAIHVVARKTL